MTETSRRNVENNLYSSTTESERYTSNTRSNYSSNGREESGPTSGSLLEREKADLKNNYGGPSSHKLYASSQATFGIQEEEKASKVSPPRRKTARDEKYEKQNNWPKKDTAPDLPAASHKQQQQQMYDTRSNNVSSRQYEQETTFEDGEIDAILEVLKFLL